MVPSIPDDVLLNLLEKEKPAFSVVDVSRVLDWCRALNRPSSELKSLEAMIKLLRERDETLRRQDLQNNASHLPVERRAGEPYVMPERTTESSEERVTEKSSFTPNETATSEKSVSMKPTDSSPSSSHALNSPKFCKMMSSESVGESAAERYRREMAERDREDAERVRLQQKKNLEERERMRQEEEKRQREDEERRRAEFEAQKRKEEERQRRIEERLAAQEAERNRKIEEQRLKSEAAARKRKEEMERREEGTSSKGTGRDGTSRGRTSGIGRTSSSTYSGRDP